MADTEPAGKTCRSKVMRDLELAGPPVGLPSSIVRPLVATTSPERLHLLALEGRAPQVAHFTLDALGRPLGPFVALPLAFAEAIAAHDRSLVIVGSPEPEGRSVLLRLSLEGEVICKNYFPTIGPVAMPRFVEESGRLQLVWSAAERRSRMLIATIEGDQLRETVAVDLDDPSFEVRAAPAAEGPVFLRTHGSDLQLELVGVFAGRVTRETLPGAMHVVSPDIAAIENGYAVLFIESHRRELMLWRLDWQLRPTGEGDVIARGADAELHSARFVKGDRGQLAIVFRMLAKSGRFVGLPSDDPANSGEPVRPLNDYVAAYDGPARTVGPILEVSDPGVHYDASAWLGDVLLLLTGEQGRVVVRYRGAPR